MKNKIKHIILTTAAALITANMFSQVTEPAKGEHLDSLINSGKICIDPVPENDSVYIFVEQMPEFPGGIFALKKYIAENIEYPKYDRSHNICSTIYVRFIVKKTGKIGTVEIQKRCDEKTDNMVINLIKTLPDFKPGMHNNKAVNVWYSVPIIMNFE